METHAGGKQLRGTGADGASWHVFGRQVRTGVGVVRATIRQMICVDILCACGWAGVLGVLEPKPPIRRDRSFRT